MHLANGSTNAWPTLAKLHITWRSVEPAFLAAPKPLSAVLLRYFYFIRKVTAEECILSMDWRGKNDVCYIQNFFKKSIHSDYLSDAAGSLEYFLFQSGLIFLPTVTLKAEK